MHEASLSMQIFRLESQICPPLFQLLSQSHPMSVCSISLISMDSENKFAMATVSCNAKTKSDNVGVISSGWGFNRQKGDRREPNIAVKWLARKESTGRKCRHLYQRHWRDWTPLAPRTARQIYDKGAGSRRSARRSNRNDPATTQFEWSPKKDLSRDYRPILHGEGYIGCRPARTSYNSPPHLTKPS